MLLICIGTIACKRSAKRPVPDVSHIEVMLDFQRGEHQLFGTDTAEISGYLKDWYEADSVFVSCYLGNILGLGAVDSVEAVPVDKLREMLYYEGFRASFDSVQAAFPDLGWLQQELTQAFRFSQYYLTAWPVPKVRTFVSEYGYGAVTCEDTVVGIGLDLFLGADYPFYPALNFPQYLIRRMDRNHILPAALEAYASAQLEIIPRGQLLIDQMVYHGKILYYLDMALPYTSDTVKIGYTAAQLEWCRTHEGEIWAYLLDEDRLFEGNRMRYGYLIGEGPTTQGMPPESPGKIGRWVGWQIVRKFMDRNPSISVAQLMAERDGKRLLEQARYRPRR